MGNDVEIVVLVDNKSLMSGVEAKWGLSLYVDAYGHRFLFDTDTDPHILERNAKFLGIDLGRIEFIVISHSHMDHAGGLRAFRNRGIRVYYPANAGLNKRIKELGLLPEPMHETTEILPNIYIIGEQRSGSNLWEQALGIRKGDELIIMTGCSHPGIDRIVSKAVSDIGGYPYLIIGGFHAPPRSVIDSIMSYDPWKIYPLHCSGESTIAYIREKNPEKLGIGGGGLRIVI